MNFDNQPTLSGETLTFRRYNWKSFRVIYGISISVIFVATMLITGVLQRSLIMFFPFPFMIFYIIGAWGLLTKITLCKEGIICKTLFKTRYYSWASVFNAGLFLKSKNSREVLHSDRYKENFFFREKFIFLTTSPAFVPGVFYGN